MGDEITVLDEDDMRKLGVSRCLFRSQGSERPARLLAMRWDGSGGAVKKPVALIGKGVTFDTGGISIKPAAGMEEMKWDMVAGGIIPPEDAAALKAAGVAAVYTPKDYDLTAILADIVDIVDRRTQEAA